MSHRGANWFSPLAYPVGVPEDKEDEPEDVDPEEVLGEIVRIRLSDALPVSVQLEPAPTADGCGATGCTTRTNLVRGFIEEIGQRVYCAPHMEDFLRREVVVR